MKEMSSPMYSTGIGIVIETIARMEHDEYLRLAEKEQKEREKRETKSEIIAEKVEKPEKGDETEETDPKIKKKKVIDLKKIVTSLTDIFSPDNIE
jgi:hypothetical protein